MVWILLSAFAAAWLGYEWPITRPDLPQNLPKTMIMIHNGNHIDLVFPRSDFFLHAPPKFQSFADRYAAKPYVAVGWGDTEFMLYHGTIDTVTSGDVFHAAFASQGSALRLSFRNRPTNTDQATVFLSEEDQKVLIQSIAVSSGEIIRELPEDAEILLRSPIQYSGWQTCNDWTADALRSVALPTPLVVTTSGSLMRYYR